MILQENLPKKWIMFTTMTRHLNLKPRSIVGNLTTDIDGYQSLDNST